MSMKKIFARCSKLGRRSCLQAGVTILKSLKTRILRKKKELQITFNNVLFL